ncbi:hypothetical protein [Actinomadura sp. SCN-SB]|uniref:hypothetical protein n=1 Tax=Actinomadura sp. SCN-SB TaxID=3373092 RepID=UPI003750CCE9
MTTKRTKGASRAKSRTWTKCFEGIEKKTLSNGNPLYRVRWREGGGRLGPRKSAYFEKLDSAKKFRGLLVGNDWRDVGCSELIAEGKIRLVHYRDIETCDAAGLRLRDATEIPADLIVLATGYENQSEAVHRLFGSAVADRVGAIWGFDEQGFMRNMWRRTAQDGFWIMGGGLNGCRLFSRFLALQIKADLEDLHPRTRSR